MYPKRIHLAIIKSETDTNAKNRGIIASMEVVKSTIEQVIADVSNGSTLTAALKTHGISRDSFRKMIERDFQLLSDYMAARRDAADTRAEEILEIADNDPDPLRARNRIDARKWYASKLDPRVYGDRIDVNVVQRVDLSSVIDEARKRALPISDQGQASDTQVIDTTGVTLNEEIGLTPSERTKSPDRIDPNDLLA